MLVIGLTGPIGSGKSVVSDYLEESHGFEEVVMGDIVRELARGESLEPTRENLHKVQGKYRDSEGLTFFAEKVVERIRSSSENKFVVNGIRRPEDVTPLEQGFSQYFTLILVIADPAIRFSRLKKRGRPGDPETFEEFKKQDRREIEKFNMEKTFEKVDYTLENNGTLEELRRRVDKLIGKFSP